MRSRFAPRALLFAVALVLSPGFTAANRATITHGLSMYGDLKYGPGFTHFDYVNPNAPKGGDITLAVTGTFDTLNPFILKGVSAVGLGNVFDYLMVQSTDEPFSEYGLIAETAEVPPDHSWVIFTLRAEARFHDGTPITADDVLWSFEALKTKGVPIYRTYYGKVARAEKLGPRVVKFSFVSGVNRELPLVMGQMPVLSKAYWRTRDFGKTTLEPPLGSGPYRVDSVDPGKSITYRRVKDYWGAKLPVRVGRNNFDTIRYEYYRDGTVALEAFKAGQYDFRQENVAKNWAIAYDIPAVRQSLIKKELIKNEVPQGMQAWVYNTRLPIFRDRRVREALGYAFDFEWTNKNLFWSAYTRTKSYFANSELASRGLPSPAEAKLLEPFARQLAPEVLTQAYESSATDGSGFIRSNLIRALELLKQAGWVVRDMKLVDAETGAPMAFEILLGEPTFERVALPFVRNLAKLGIAARVRTVDSAQYQHRLEDFDFDMTVWVWPESLSPGNEQLDFWSSKQADVPGSGNVAGIKDAVVDELVRLVIAAPDRQSLIDRTRGLDRVLLWGHYAIPHWHIPSYRVAYWDKFERPKIAPKYDLGFDAWWIDMGKAAKIAAAQGHARK